VLVPGVATGVGSLPHSDPSAAAALVLRLLPEMPSVPQLPARDAREGMIAQWAAALPEVHIERDGALRVVGTSDAAPDCVVDHDAHAGLLAFLDAVALLDRAPSRVKVQLTGPLTLGVALHAAGMPVSRAFARAALLTRVWSQHLEQLFTARMPETALVLFYDEPALVSWRRGDGVLDRERAIDVLSGSLADVDCVTGVHVCGDGDVALALAAGPEVLGVEVSDDLVEHSVAISRFLDGDGCELTRRGCDPVPLRARGLITPACGLAGYGASQAERVLGIARELAARVHDQAVAARLTLGA
jgi:hypothetical protein